MRSHAKKAITAFQFQGLAIASLSLLLTSCYNNNVKPTSKSSSTSSGSNAISNIVVNYGTYKIAGVSVGTSATSGSTGLPVTITFDLSGSTNSMLSSCTKETGSNPCLCKFSWNELNTATGATLTIPHQVFTNVTAVQAALVSCTTPITWQTEIPDNTSISITVVPASSNPGQFNVSSYAFTKGSNVVTGNFTDSMGRSFVNILRYSCYEQRKRGLSLTNKIGVIDVNGVGSFGYLTANQFCLRDANGDTKGGTGCETLSPADYTSQSYYYNMFIRDSESGDINPGNEVFVCPTVTESLNQQKDGGGNPIIGTQGKYWPLDTSFALSLGKTSDYSIGVVAHSKTTNSSDPSAQNSSCDGTTTSPGDANSLITSCLGFAAKPNPDGSCPKTGGIATYRLRRYVTVYPSIYDTNGNLIKESQRTDMVYVLDRPVLDNSGNPLKDSKGNAYSMLGPKPCPFAYFDGQNVTGSGYGYYGTNNSAWTGKSVDNIFFPYQDTGSRAAGSCSAFLPTVDSNRSNVSGSTLTSKLYVRPVQAWAPHYEEDTGFQACAPQSTPLRDPPLHFAMNGTNMAWCAEVYPSQNDNYARLPSGSKNYTSHKKKNVTGGGSCPAASSSISVAGHLGADATTCDRTVVNTVGSTLSPRFPLLAPETEVVSALQSDPSFGCTMTYDNAGGKVNSSDFSQGKSPTQGCCANASPPAGAGQSAHLEPTPAPTATGVVAPVSCTPPKY